MACFLLSKSFVTRSSSLCTFETSRSVSTFKAFRVSLAFSLKSTSSWFAIDNASFASFSSFDVTASLSMCFILALANVCSAASHRSSSSALTEVFRSRFFVTLSTSSFKPSIVAVNSLAFFSESFSSFFEALFPSFSLFSKELLSPSISILCEVLVSSQLLALCFATSRSLVTDLSLELSPEIFSSFSLASFSFVFSASAAESRIVAINVSASFNNVLVVSKFWVMSFRCAVCSPSDRADDSRC